MQLNFRRSLSGFGVLFLALAPLQGALQAQPQARSLPPQRGSQNNPLGRGSMLEGTVTTRRDNNEFDLRVGGATFRVRSAYLVTVRTGDRAVVRGSFRSNNAFDAQSVRINGARGNGAGNGSDFDLPGEFESQVDFPAVVTRVFSRRDIEVRGDNNRLYRVDLRQDFGALRVGSRLRVRGEMNDNRVVDARLLVQGAVGGGYYGGNGNYGPNDGNYDDDVFDGNIGGNGNYGGDFIPGTVGRSVDFPGRVVRVDTLRNEATVRGDNGRDYLVRGPQVDTVRNGDRVRVRGQANGQTIELNRLDIVL